MSFGRTFCLTAAALLAGVIGLGASAGDLHYSNKWRIQISEGANNDGTIQIRVTPKDGTPPTELSVPIKDGRSENGVARDVKNALKASLDPARYHVEGDDGEDVLVKKKGDASDFALEVTENLKGTHINLDRE
jgi:hypothetical protein